MTLPCETTVSGGRTKCRCGLSWDTGDAHPPQCPHLLGDDEQDRFAGLMSGLMCGASALGGVILAVTWLFWRFS